MAGKYIRAIGQDRELQRQVVKEAQKAQAKQITSLEADQRRHEKKLTKVRDEITGLLQALAKGDVQGHSISDRLLELETKAGEQGQKVDQVGTEVEILKQSAIDGPELAEALSLFDPIWEVLYPAEQARIIELLIERVDHDGAAGTMGIEFAPAGVKLLSEELNLNKEGAA